MGVAWLARLEATSAIERANGGEYTHPPTCTVCEEQASTGVTTDLAWGSGAARRGARPFR